MTKEKLNQVSFSSSFFAKLISFMLGIGCFYLLGSGEMLTFVASKVQADFFIPPFLFKILLFLCYRYLPAMVKPSTSASALPSTVTPDG